MSEPPRYLTIDEIVAWKQPVDCQISPDGSRVAYAVADIAHVGKLPPSSIWLATTQGDGASEQITSGTHHDSHPRWSRDGRSLAFISDRASPHVCQVYIVDSSLGDAKRVTDFEAGVTAFHWSPDGTRIGCIVPSGAPPVSPRARSDGAVEGASAPVPSGAPPASPQAPQSTTESDAVVFSDFKPRNGLVVVSIDKGSSPIDVGALVQGSIHVLDCDWSPDGEAMVVAGTKEPRIDEAFRGVRLWRIPLGGDPARSLLTTEGGADVQPRWSPDGRWIAYRSGAAKTYLALTLSIVPAAGGEPRNLTINHELSLHGHAWLPDSSGLAIAIQRDMHSSLEQIDLESGAIKPLAGFNRDLSVLGRIEQTFISFDTDLTTIASIHEHDYAPRALWIQRKGEAERLAGLPTVAVDDVHLSEVRQLSWPGRDGLSISGSLVVPPGATPGQRFPLVVQVHGGPASVYQRSFQAAWNEWGQLLASHGFVVLRANPRGSGGRGLDFLAANHHDWGGGDFDDILRGIDCVIDLGLVDDQRVGIGGWSYGGYMTAWAVTHSDRFRCGVIGAPVINLASFCGTTDIPYGFLPSYYVGADFIENPDYYRDRSPLYSIDSLKVPTLLLHGEVDVRVPLGQSVEWYTAARERGRQVELVTYPREDHSIKEPEHQRDVLKRVVGWFNRYLQSGK